MWVAEERVLRRHGPPKPTTASDDAPAPKSNRAPRPRRPKRHNLFTLINLEKCDTGMLVLLLLGCATAGVRGSEGAAPRLPHSVLGDSRPPPPLPAECSCGAPDDAHTLCERAPPRPHRVRVGRPD